MVDTSVIIPVYNDPDGLQTTVDSLLNQTYEDYEIIIVDNGSTDNTLEIAKDYSQHSNVRVAIENVIQGSYAARNTGIEASQGDVLAFVDADMWVENDYIEVVSNKIQTANVDYIGCNVEVASSGDILSRYVTAIGFPVKRYIEVGQFAPTCCLTVHRRVIEDVGSFDERLISSGDAEFGKRVAKAGYKIEYVPDITIYHPARSTWSELRSKYIRVGRGFVQRAKYHPDKFSRSPIYHPKLFLLPHPLVFLDRIEGEANSITDIFIWYLFHWMKKLYTHKGRVIEVIDLNT